ncbi:MAG: hypothetical protein RL398_2068 [Planctomycetota bacterium]|jgi:hypothetical protein
MNLATAVQDVLLGASIRQVGAAYRAGLIEDFGFRSDEVKPETFREETSSFLRKLARELGERHAGDPRVGQALREWVMMCDHYEAWDALLSGFAVDGRDALLRKGRILFPGPLTAHWQEA